MHIKHILKALKIMLPAPIESTLVYFKALLNNGCLDFKTGGNCRKGFDAVLPIIYLERSVEAFSVFTTDMKNRIDDLRQHTFKHSTSP